ncbi:MAG: biosynthetic arginine decarboxylase [Myxococcota bacterium]
MTTTWTTRDSAELYGIAGWGNGYFDINDEGHVILTSEATGTSPIDLKKAVDDLVRRGLSLPLLIRFTDILRRRIEEIYGAFGDKIEEYGYKGRYRAVMPIKVNQQRHVVEELLEQGSDFDIGLEAGSKPELLVAIAMLPEKSGLIVCNGYKDLAYIEAALLAQRLGHKTLLIVDRFDELQLIIDTSRRLGIDPSLGVRCKLSAKGSGKWAESGGDRSKFGLTATELVRTVEVLSQAGMLNRLQCLHFHIGSQITAIRAIKDAMGEAVRIFTDLYKMGAPMAYLDVGGGLAVDYDGSKANFHASRNYSLAEYAADIVYSVGSALDEAGIPHPTIISESGRALVAYHSALIFNVVGHAEESKPTPRPPRPTAETNGAVSSASEASEHQLIEELREVEATVTRKNYHEAYHDAVQLKEDALSLYRHGILDLRDRATVEGLFWSTCRKIWRIVKDLEYVPEDIEPLERQLANTYYCNFSLFQSVPDSWAVKALFPVMPIHRLNQKPNRRGILADLTCDSDGKMDQFIGLHDVKDCLELHPYEPGETYLLGTFLVGAYQEVLGDLHNLFGDVHAVHLASGPTGYRVKSVIEGDTVRDVLGYVSYGHRQLMDRLRQSIEGALGRGTMSLEQSAVLVRNFEAGLSGYTYLEDRASIESLFSSVLPGTASADIPPSQQT